MVTRVGMGFIRRGDRTERERVETESRERRQRPREHVGVLVWLLGLDKVAC